MSYYYDDFYDEPTEFDEQIEEFKESLMGSIKDEYIDKMKRLEKENQELQEVKKNFEKIQMEYERKKAEYDRAIQNAKLEVKKATMEELLEEYKCVLYMAQKGEIFLKKCNKCNKFREVEITLPSGKVVKDSCECNKSFQGFYPETVVLYDIEKNKCSPNEIRFFYQESKIYKDSFRLSESICYLANDNFVKQGTDFEDIKTDTPLFYTYEECLAYCKYQNKKNGIPDDAIYDMGGNVLLKEEQ